MAVNVPRRKRVRTLDTRSLSAIQAVIVEWLAQSPATSAQGRYLSLVAEKLPAMTHRAYSQEQIIESVAQTVVHARVAWSKSSPALRALAGRQRILPPPETLLGAALSWISCDDDDAVSDETCRDFLAARFAEIDPLVIRPTHDAQDDRAGAADYDTWLSGHDRRRRAALGVYYTPPPIAAFIVQSVDDLLRHEFLLPDGLADTTPWKTVSERSSRVSDEKSPDDDAEFVRILDPALGTGVFLLEVLERIHRTLTTKWRAAGLDTTACLDAWNDYVRRHLLARLTGLELLMAPAAVAWIRLADRLAITGYEFESFPGLDIRVADTLAGPPMQIGSCVCERTSAGASRIAAGENPVPFTVVVGNPPFSALATETSAWIASLMRASKFGDEHVGSYYDVDGQPLGERKLWLHDIYVKFLRHAQWCIHQAGCGIAGLVSNHGYLDNVTFRGVRQSLLATFSRIALVDLHGNRKKHESDPGGSRDENVFEIEQGIAIALLRRLRVPQPPRVTYAEIWGTRPQKLDTLATNRIPAASTFAPVTPYYFFVPVRDVEVHASEYLRGFPLNEIMPVNSSAAVTARDAFVVAFTRQELIDRCRMLCDRNLSDEEILHRFFQTTRSRRYRIGETRGWKIGEARRRAREVEDPGSLVVPCQYRPFDRRHALWADWLVDWPRNRVMRHMLGGDNLALIARRQMLPGRPCNFFWISDSLVLDGLVRSDNRGSESFFPLYLRSETESGNGGVTPVNFSRDFLARCTGLWQLEAISEGSGNLETTLGPENLLAMIYAQFFSMRYRERYADPLRWNFPRVFLPRSRALLGALCLLGRQLVDLHLLRGASPASAIRVRNREHDDRGASRQRSRHAYPEHLLEKILVSDSTTLSPVAEATWEFQVGAHQVCRKWLRDRRNHPLSVEDLLAYERIVQSVERTVELSAAIDLVIEQFGGWPDAFAGRTP